MQKTKKTKVLGVTGNIGGGKSTVVSVFADKGGKVIDADLLGREVVEQSRNFRNWLRERFGFGIFSGEVLDRAALGRIVFSDAAAKRDLDTQIWPLIRERIVQQVGKVQDEGFLPVVDAALIYEWGDETRYDEILVVAADPEEAVQRAAARLGLPVEEIRPRFSAQLPIEQKVARADAVIRNTGSLEELKGKADLYWQNLIERWNFRHDS